MKKNDEDREGWARAPESVIRGACGAHEYAHGKRCGARVHGSP